MSTLLAILATWRISAMLCYGYEFEWLRQHVGVDFVGEDDRPLGLWAKILDCFWCTSLCVSFPVAGVVLVGWDWVLLPFALSGGGILLQHWTRINRDVLQG